VEEKDDDSEAGDVESKISYDKNRLVNSMYIPIRLMTNFKKYPAIYTDEHEKESLIIFEKAFKNPTKFLTKLRD
jgi:hypothetical protein